MVSPPLGEQGKPHWPWAEASGVVVCTHQLAGWPAATPSLQYQPKGQVCAVHPSWQVGPDPEPSSMHWLPDAHFVESHLAADGTKDDGIIKSHLYVTLHARMPAVLIETAFLTNPGDYALLTSAAWRQKVAQEIADGIGQYAQAYPVPNQPAQ